MKRKIHLALVIVGFVVALAVHSAVARPWVPTDATNGTLVVWFDADDASTLWADTNATIGATASVARWNDKSGNGNNATQGTGASQPTYSNATTELYFDDGDALNVANDPFRGLQNFAALLVSRWDGDGGTYDSNSIGFNGQDVNSGWSIRSRFGDQLNFTGRGSWGDLGAQRDISLMTNDFVGAGFRYDSTTSEARLNGTVYGTTAKTNAIAYSTHVNRSSIGAGYTADNWSSPQGYLKGWIKEVVVIDGASLDTVQKIEGYLAWKWGLEAKLDEGHPYKSGPPPDIPPAGTVIVIK